MLIEYYTTLQQDDVLFEWMKNKDVKWTNAFNPEDDYFVLETDDKRVPTIMTLMGMHIYCISVAQGDRIRSAEADL